MSKLAFLNTNIILSKNFNSSLYDSINSNIGNSYITFSMCRLLGINLDKAVIKNNIWKYDPAEVGVQARFDGISHILLCLQDHLRVGAFPDEDYDRALRFLQELKEDCPMTAVSLGANTLTGHDPSLHTKLSSAQKRFFSYLGDRCQSIGVRGYYTADVLDKLGVRNTSIVGCPSYFAGGPDRMVALPADRCDRPTIGVTGAFVSPFGWTSDHYLQGDFDWPIVRSLHDPTFNDSVTAALLPHQWIVNLASASREGRAHFFTDFTAWQRRISDVCQVVCGTRLHGAIVSLNAGVPAIVTNNDSRAQETCEFFGIGWRPEFQSDPPSRNAILEAADPTSVNALYKLRYDAFISWISKTGIMPDERPRFDLLQLERLSDDEIAKRSTEILRRLIPHKDRVGSCGQLAVSTDITLDRATHAGRNIVVTAAGITIILPDSSAGFMSGEMVALKNISGSSISLRGRYAYDGRATMPSGSSCLLFTDGGGFWRCYCYSEG